MNCLTSQQTHKKNSLRWALIGALLMVLFIIVLSWIVADPGIRIVLVLILASLAGATTARFIYTFKAKRGWKYKTWLGFLSCFAMLLVVLAIKWKAVSDKGGQVRQEPFRIAGNLYYVGTKDVTSFLLADPKGCVLIDGGYPGTADMIIRNIELLGFKIKDVKILLSSHGHLDHAGGLATLQKASGAELWASEPEADMITSAGVSHRNMGIMNFLIYLGLAKYPAPHVNHIFKDRAKIRLGSIELTAYITPGHTPGCTSWAIPVKDGDRKLLAVSIGSLTLLPVSMFGQRYDTELQNEFNQSFKTLRSIPADIFLGSHASFFDMGRKLKERDTATNPVSPFIDSSGYLKYIDNSENELRTALIEQQRKN